KEDVCHHFPYDTSLLITGQKMSFNNPLQTIVPKADAAITGSHRLLFGGRNVAPTKPNCEGNKTFFESNARTVVGLTAGNRALLIAAVDCCSNSHGITLPQAAQLMTLLGAQNALNLDGG